MPELKLSPFVRPQSAVGARHVAAENAPPRPADRTFRPWTTHPGQRRDVSSHKVQRLRQSHLRAAGRKQDPPGGRATVVGFTSPPTTSSVDLPDDRVELEVVTMVNSGAESAAGDSGKRAPTKQHPTFDTWVSGSPHDSDEYSTDLEDEPAAETNSRISSDASGVDIYEQQCKRDGLVPVSYLRRHMGKRSIRMRHHYLGGNAARALAYAFRRNTITEIMDLSDNYLQSGGAVYMAAMLKDNAFLVSLDLSNNFIGSHGCVALAEMLDVNTTLKSLNLAGNQLTDGDMHHFIEPLKNNLSLTCLNLSHNNLGSMAGVHLAAVLSVNDGISDLDLSWNSIRREGAVALANALKVNTVVETLDLSWNGLAEDGCAALQQSLPANTSLKVLDLTNNRMDVKAGLKLAAGLKNNFGLETLIVNQNHIGDEGIEALLGAADVHRSLRFLSLEELGLSTQNVQHIQELEQTKGLITLHGGAGGYQRNTSVMSVLRLLGRFSREHLTDLETEFHDQDKDHQGILTADETKLCLRAAGLRLTNRQLDILIDEIDFSHSGRIQYREILSGKLFDEYHKRRPSRGFALTSVKVSEQNDSENGDL
ncbi:uncharacterized protein LOC143284882 isoform X2 [Babylonia areolata]|uniref:uncharacterized protein LOC143284882 isoform X2 n=1 Tax=Babylonia areolata TaxID=304850 RepID=UPI003FD23160